MASAIPSWWGRETSSVFHKKTGKAGSLFSYSRGCQAGAVVIVYAGDAPPGPEICPGVARLAPCASRLIASEQVGLLVRGGCTMGDIGVSLPDRPVQHFAEHSARPVPWNGVTPIVAIEFTCRGSRGSSAASPTNRGGQARSRDDGRSLGRSLFFHLR